MHPMAAYLALQGCTLARHCLYKNTDRSGVRVKKQEANNEPMLVLEHGVWQLSRSAELGVYVLIDWASLSDEWWDKLELSVVDNFLQTE